MSRSPNRKLRKMGSFGYLFVQIPSKMQDKYGLTNKDHAKIEDEPTEVVIRIKKKNLGERVYGEKDYNSTTKMVIPIAEP